MTIDTWSDLDGAVERYKGWWVRTCDLGECIEETDCSGFEVAVEFEHCGIKLKGKHCHILGTLDNGTVFVEFDEDVNGCSADGLGKSGHCVALKAKLLASRKRSKSAK